MATNESLLYRENFSISDSYGTRSRRTGSVQCLQVIFCGLNVLFMIFGVILTAIGIWIIIDRTFLYPVLDQVLIILAPSMMLAGGAFGFIVCLIGFIGAAYQKKGFLLFYVAASTIVILLLFVAAVLAIMLMLQAWNEEHMRLSMRHNLQEYYGINLDNSFNRMLTEGWDRTQSMLMCCSVEDLSWDVYQKSQWYEDQPGIPRTGPFVPGTEYKRFVPKSCCVTHVEGSFIDGTTRSDGNYVDLDTCQTNPYGPPRDQTGLDNKALYYRGCYTAAIHYLRQIQVPVIIGLTAGMAILMIVGPILAVCLFKRLSNVKARLNNSRPLS